MAKYYLFSGIDKHLGFTKKQATYLKKDLPNNLTITFITSSFDKYEVNDDYYNNMLAFFDKIKIKIKTSYLIDDRMTQKEAIKCINKSDAVFIMGGYPGEEMENIVKYKLVNSLKRFNGIIMSVSAGSINMNKHVCYVNKDQTLTEYDGIGLTDFNLAPHLDFSKEGYLREIYTVSNIRKTLGLPNDSFVVVDDGKVEIVGEYYYFDKGTIQN